ncbi:hypothetical protein [Thermococcus aciditolerans]|uniref:Uncharacterized protein n=1 Tax=Thermococcus aciditolerans TaxID=2598455 RepID=A0A5C0SMU4_9EURY|nr:hypothetical protein [Thermococcus aciditolerans]QEK14754.1 hypothetical protein FPV09_06200 [Thermococcus aciditolerans]
MSGVNLIDFTMPSAAPAPSGGKTETRNVGGMKLVLPKKKEKQTEAEVAEEKAKRREWWKALLPLLGIIIVIKLATWYARRYGK